MLLEILVAIVVVAVGAKLIQPFVAHLIHVQRLRLRELGCDEDRVEVEKYAIDLTANKRRQQKEIETYRQERLNAPARVTDPSGSEEGANK